MIGPLQLRSHPAFPSHQTDRVDFFLERPSAGRLWLRYMIWGPAEALALSHPSDADRADDLWKTTCLELFVRDADAAIYFEFNFSPSTRWAAYRFQGYRDGRTDLFVPSPPRIDLSFADDLFDMEVTLDLNFGDAAMLAPAAIVEETDGTKSFWALSHSPGKPDFHDPACFALELPPAPAA